MTREKTSKPLGESFFREYDDLSERDTAEAIAKKELFFTEYDDLSERDTAEAIAKKELFFTEYEGYKWSPEKPEKHPNQAPLSYVNGRLSVLTQINEETVPNKLPSLHKKANSSNNYEIPKLNTSKEHNIQNYQPFPTVVNDSLTTKGRYEAYRHNSKINLTSLKQTTERPNIPFLTQNISKTASERRQILENTVPNPNARYCDLPKISHR